MCEKRFPLERRIDVPLDLALARKLNMGSIVCAVAGLLFLVAVFTATDLVYETGLERTAQSEMADWARTVLSLLGLLSAFCGTVMGRAARKQMPDAVGWIINLVVLVLNLAVMLLFFMAPRH